MTIDYKPWTCYCCGSNFSEKIWPYLIDGNGNHYCEICFGKHAGVNVIKYAKVKKEKGLQ